jgi:transcriptional regulator GlxA family with amidase domain
MIHLAQLLRLAFPDVQWIFDAVPLAGAAFFLVLTWLVLTDQRALQHFSQVTTAPVETATADDFGELERYMQLERPHLDPRLTLEHLARAIGVSPRRLSRSINEAAGGFYDYVNKHRVADARALLTDPAEQRTSVEAIGLMVGFRSRSTFYEAFRKATGMTPAAYRKMSV